MKTTSLKSLLLLFSATLIMVACDVEDPGPIQEVRKEYSLIDFDQLEMGSGFNIRVEEGNTFLIEVRGDRRNINDLEVYKSGSTLIMEYEEHTTRRHDTYITIRMPFLKAANFSGGSVSLISGFETDGVFDLYLSGGSVCQLDGGYHTANLTLSGGSTLKMRGLGDILKADISGASQLSAYEYPVSNASLNLSGASRAKVTVTDILKISASGASSVFYKGNPQVEKSVSGGSSVESD